MQHFVESRESSPLSILSTTDSSDYDSDVDPNEVSVRPRRQAGIRARAVIANTCRVRSMEQGVDVKTEREDKFGFGMHNADMTVFEELRRPIKVESTGEVQDEPIFTQMATSGSRLSSSPLNDAPLASASLPRKQPRLVFDCVLLTSRKKISGGKPRSKRTALDFIDLTIAESSDEVEFVEIRKRTRQLQKPTQSSVSQASHSGGQLSGSRKRRGESIEPPKSSPHLKRPKLEGGDQKILSVRDSSPSRPSASNTREVGDSDAQEDCNKFKLWQNSKIKKKKNDPVLHPETIRSRIRHIGFNIQDQFITIDKLVTESMVTREFMSNIYGGSSQKAFPPINAQRFAQHGKEDFMYMNTSFQPLAPELPGAPGLWFNPNIGHIGRRRAFRKIAGQKPDNKWLYVGQYDVYPANPPYLSVEEWRTQPTALRNTWANAIAYKGWGDWVRARITLRRSLGREPQDQECEKLLNSGCRMDVTAEEVNAAYHAGQESPHLGLKRMVVWTMKCIGYDNGFQEDLSEMYPIWATLMAEGGLVYY